MDREKLIRPRANTAPHYAHWQEADAYLKEDAADQRRFNEMLREEPMPITTEKAA